MNFRKIKFKVTPKEHPYHILEFADDILSKSEGCPILIEKIDSLTGDEEDIPVGYVKNLTMEEDGIWGDFTIWGTDKNFTWLDCGLNGTIPDMVDIEQSLLHVKSISAVWITEEEEGEKNELSQNQISSLT